jgi:hypothetical protein
MRTLRPSAACALVFVVGASALAGCSALAEIGSWTFDPLADAGALADATREPDGASDDGADSGGRVDAGGGDGGDAADATSGDAAGPVLGVAPAADCSVRRRFPNLNHGADALIHVGSNALVANTTFNIDRALLRFDADAIKRVLGARRLRTARLRLTVFNIADTFADSNLEAHRMMAAWTESGVTWTCADDVTPLDTSENCRPPGPWDMLGTSAPPWSPTVAGSVPVTHATRSVELELTAEVSHWLEDSASNLGIVLLLPGDKGNAWLNFESHESDVSSPSPPMLELEVDDGGG